MFKRARRPGRPPMQAPAPITLAAVSIVLLAAAAAPAHAAALPGNHFAVTQHTYFLTGDAASSAGHDGGFQLAPDAPGAQGQQTFLLPGVNALGLVHQASKATWFGAKAWDK